MKVSTSCYLGLLVSSLASAATISYTFENIGTDPLNTNNVNEAYTAPDSNDFGAGVTVSTFTMTDRDASQYSRFVNIGGDTIEAGVGSGNSDLVATFEITIDDTVTVDLDDIIFDTSARWTNSGSVDDVFVDFFVTVGSDQSNVVNFDWIHNGAPNYQNQADQTVTFSTLTGVDLTGLTDTTVTFTWELGTDRNNNFGVITQGLDDIVLTGSVSSVPEPSSFALVAGCLGLTSVMLRRRR